MNKTIYVRDEDVPIWDRAKELAGEKLAPVIMEGLKRYVAEKEAEVKGFERIEVRYDDADRHSLPKAKAFYGRWIFPISDPLRCVDEDFANSYSVAITAKGAAVVYAWDSDRECSKFNETFRVFESLEAAATDPQRNYAARKAIEKLGVPVQELDI